MISGKRNTIRTRHRRNRASSRAAMQANLTIQKYFKATLQSFCQRGCVIENFLLPWEDLNIDNHCYFKLFFCINPVGQYVLHYMLWLPFQHSYVNELILAPLTNSYCLVPNILIQFSQESERKKLENSELKRTDSFDTTIFQLFEK